jgi:hypothetical protein
VLQAAARLEPDWTIITERSSVRRGGGAALKTAPVAPANGKKKPLVL